MNVRHSVQLFGSQRRGNRPKFSHTYATLSEKVTRSDGTESIEKYTFSWLPADGVIDPFGKPESGENYRYGRTIDWLNAAASTVRWQSPDVDVVPEFFPSAMDRYQELERHVLRYVMIDSLATRPHDASNCIHAISDIPLAIEQLGMLNTYTLHGISASRRVFEYFSPFFVRKEDARLNNQDERFFEELDKAYFASAVANDNLVESIATAIKEYGPLE
jgi:hypothetical protein